MVLYHKIRAWITSDKYLEPGRKVDKWLEVKYFELIRRLEEKYPEGTIAGVSTEDFDVCKIFVAYKRRFGARYNHHDLKEHFYTFWQKCMKRDPRLQSVWNISTPDWDFLSRWQTVRDYYRTINEGNIIIWNNRKEPITEEYIREYFADYVRNEFTSVTFKDFTKKYPNILAESASKKYSDFFFPYKNPHFMAMKCLGNLTYEETFRYFKEAFQPAEKFKISFSLDCEKDSDYKGFPEDRERRYNGTSGVGVIRFEFEVKNMRK